MWRRNTSLRVRVALAFRYLAGCGQFGAVGETNNETSRSCSRTRGIQYWMQPAALQLRQRCCYCCCYCVAFVGRRRGMGLEYVNDSSSIQQGSQHRSYHDTGCARQERWLRYCQQPRLRWLPRWTCGLVRYWVVLSLLLLLMSLASRRLGSTLGITSYSILILLNQVFKKGHKTLYIHAHLGS